MLGEIIGLKVDDMMGRVYYRPHRRAIRHDSGGNGGGSTPPSGGSKYGGAKVDSPDWKALAASGPGSFDLLLPPLPSLGGGATVDSPNWKTLIRQDPSIGYIPE